MNYTNLILAWTISTLLQIIDQIFACNPFNTLVWGKLLTQDCDIWHRGTRK